MPTWEKRERTWVSQAFLPLRKGPLALCCQLRGKELQAAPMGREKCSQKGWISSWESSQTSTSVLGVGWALVSYSLGKRTKWQPLRTCFYLVMRCCLWGWPGEGDMPPLGCRLKPLLDRLAATAVADCSAFWAKGFCLLWVSSYRETSWLLPLQWEGLHTNRGSGEVAAHLSKPDTSPSHTSFRREAISPTHQVQKLFSSNRVWKALETLTFSPPSD